MDHLSPNDTLVVLNKTDLLDDSGSTLSSQLKSHFEPAVVGLFLTFPLYTVRGNFLNKLINQQREIVKCEDAL